MNWSSIAPMVAPFAPTIGGLLGGLIPFPGGAILGKMAGGMVAEALGVPPTPEAVKEAIETRDPVVVHGQLSDADAKMQAEIEKHKADLADVQDARATSLEQNRLGSRIAWAPAVVSVVVMLGFLVLSFIAMRPDLTDVRSDVTLFLLGAWSGYAGAVVTYWLGSSAGSKDKTETLYEIATRKVPPPPPAKPPVRK
jgi:hypothetical protein